MTVFFIAIMGGICVAAVILAVVTAFRDPADTAMHDRLDMLAGKKTPTGVDETSVLSRPLDDMPNAIEEFVSNFFNIRRLLEQANVEMKTEQFVGLCCALAGVGFVIAFFSGLHFALYFILPAVLFPLPFAWLLHKRRGRMKLFTKQLPEALDMTGRALRAGHSLGAGFQMVAAEIPEPLGTEFGRVYEEQNLGIALEDALTNMCERVPTFGSSRLP